MTRKDIAKQIAHLPETYDTSDWSTAALIQKSGLLESREELSAADIEPILRAEPGLTEEWHRRWGDQRIAGGWVMDCEGDSYRLKHFETGRTVLIGDKYRAFSEFIARYIRRIGRVIAKYENIPQATPAQMR